MLFIAFNCFIYFMLVLILILSVLMCFCLVGCACERSFLGRQKRALETVQPMSLLWVP